MSNNELMSSIDDQTLANIMNKRHKSAKSQFRNPPQPRFCIRERTSDGQELFINVLSYSRIANQLSEFDPIPLYGGMQIRSYSSIKNAAHIQQSPTPQLIFAVMASPDVLKKTSRNSDSVEQMNLVELICEFLEAMNPGIVLSKKPEILRDRDLAGELKDVWTAVQNFRDKEKAGISDIVVYTEFGPDTAQESMKAIHRSEPPPNNGKPVKSEIHDASKLDHHHSEQHSETYREKDLDGEENNAVEKEVSMPEKSVVDESDAPPNIEIDKLSLGDKKLSSKNNENHHSNESSEKHVKIQNQKNKESHFFPKFLSSSKEKDSNCKDKEKEKEKDKQETNEQEPKSKTKKSLNFFRRNKSSPTNSSNNSNLNSNQKSDSNPQEH